MPPVWQVAVKPIPNIVSIEAPRTAGVDKIWDWYYNGGMKKLPVGIQTFSKLINGNYLYVDKTEDIYNLLSGGGQYYFLSRPRRFGKSLLISTLKEIFSGNKELFKGLWIYDKWKWEEYPVIHLDFLGLEYAGREQLIKTLEFLLNQNAAVHGVQLTEEGYEKHSRNLLMMRNTH